MALEQTATRPIAIKRLDLPLRKQQASEWCWAAVSQAVCLYYDVPSTSLDQCRIVGDAFNQACCGKGDSPVRDPACNRPGFLHEVLDRHTLLAKPRRDPRSGAIRGPVSFARLRRQIDQGRPVCVLIKWRDVDLYGGEIVGNRGHFILIEGYSISASKVPYVFVRNPLSPKSLSHHPYEVISSHASGQGYQDGQGVWAWSFLVQPRPAAADPALAKGAVREVAGKTARPLKRRA